jgi:hypothetical protein
MGKSTISTGPFSIATLVITRGIHRITPLESAWKYLLMVASPEKKKHVRHYVRHPIEQWFFTCI